MSVSYAKLGMRASIIRALKGFLPRTISRDQAKDTGMAMAVICLLIGHFGHYYRFFIIAILLLILNMIAPNIYRPLAVVWFGLANILGTVVSKILLTVIFFILVTPVGLIRRISGADSLQLKKWKKDAHSVFKVRDHPFGSDEIEKPY